MARWGLEGMASFQQGSVAEKERSRLESEASATTSSEASQAGHAMPSL